MRCFAKNPGDGGILLPAAADRKILEPHDDWFFDRSYVEAWHATARVDSVYVGAQPAPACDRRWTAEQLDSDPPVQLVHQNGRERVYRIKDGAGPTFDNAPTESGNRDPALGLNSLGAGRAASACAESQL